MGRRIFIFISIFILGIFTLSAQFEGSINFVYSTVYDTIYYSYYVKGNMVRMDEYGMNKKLTKSLLIDISQEKVYAVNAEKKLFKELPVDNNLPTDTGYVVIKSNYYKIIEDRKCYQWRVKNKDQNTEITYWVANEGFNFYDNIARILKKHSISNGFFSYIPESNGFLPILTVERTLLRDEKGRLWVSSIEPKNLNNKLFNIPSDYKQFMY